MGHDDGKRMLWIFGAGASAHLGFPLAAGFIRSTVSLITEHFTDADDLRLNIARYFQPGDFKRGDGSPITNDDGRKTNTCTT